MKNIKITRLRISIIIKWWQTHVNYPL